MTGTTPNHVKIEPKTSNVILGRGAADNIDGSMTNSVLIGYYTGGQASGVGLERNVYVGTFNGYGNTDGKFNTFLGSNAGVFAKTNNSVFLGYQAGLYEQEDHRLIINARSDVGEEPFIYGKFDSRWLKVDGALALGNTDFGSSGNTATQFLVSGKYGEGVNAGSEEGTYKIKIEGYENDGNKVYPLAMIDEDGQMDFYIENNNTVSLRPRMHFDGTMSIGGYDNMHDNHLVLQTAGSSFKTGLSFRHFSESVWFYD